MKVHLDGALARRCLLLATASQALVVVLYMLPGVDLSFHGGGPFPALVYVWIACLPGLAAAELLPGPPSDLMFYVVLFTTDIVVWFVVAYASVSVKRVLVVLARHLRALRQDQD